MIPVWIKNKKTGGYDRIPYDLMVKGKLTRKGRQLWYVHCLHVGILDQIQRDGSDTFVRYRALCEMIQQHPEYFLHITDATYLFIGKKWGLMDRCLNRLARGVLTYPLWVQSGLPIIIGVLVGAATLLALSLLGWIFG